MPAYYTILTTLGLQRLAEAQMSGVPLIFTEFAVGDGDGAAITPAVGMTALVSEVWRGDVNLVEISSDAPTTVRIEGLIPSSDGGFTIREAGLFNAAGELIAVASYPPVYKPTPAEGVTAEEYIRILIEYAAVEAVALTTDPDVVTATRAYVEDMTAGGLWLWENFT
jgi:phage-related tail fiber protein